MEWQPIETAPKGGTRFLAWGNAMNERFEPHWEIVLAWWSSYMLDGRDRGGWVTIDEQCGGEGGFTSITHWMPLPSPPDHSG